MDKNILNKLALVEKLSHGFVLVQFCLSTFFNYASIALLFDEKNRSGSIFMQIVYIIGIGINLINLAVIITNLYINYRYRNLFERTQTGYQSILFLICIPAGILAVTVETIYVMAIFDRTDTNIEYSIAIFSKFLMLVVLTSLLIHANTHCDFGEAWLLNLSNMLTLEMTITNLLSRVIITVGQEQVTIFLGYLHVRKDPVVNKDSIGYVLEDMYQGLFSFYYKFECITCLVGIALLLGPFVRHYKFVQKYKAKQAQVNEEPEAGREGIFTIPVIVTSAIILAINIIFMATYASQVDEPFQLKIVICVMYIVAIVNSYFIYNDVSKCSFKPARGLPGNILLWVGTFGQLMEVIAYIQHSVHSTMVYGIVPVDVTIWIQYILLTILCIVQNLAIASIFERKKTNVQHNEITAVLSSPLILLLLNVLYFVRTIFILHFPMVTFKNSYLFVILFESGFLLVGGVFAALHRAYAAIILLDYLRV